MVVSRAQSERVVVTGGSGFIGRAVVDRFVRQGAHVVLVDRELPDREPDDRITVITGELADPAVRVASITPDTAGVIHLAAITSVLRSVEMPAETFATNVIVTQELLELCRRHEVPRFLLASTNAVTGNVGSATITADLPLAPLTPYGATKAAAEMLQSGYAGSYGIATTALRFSNVYGPGMSHKDSFVPRMMRAALDGEIIRIYGDGQQRRDLVHLDDVVEGIALAWEAQHTGRVILGSGTSVSVLEMVAAVREVTGLSLPVQHVEAPKGEMSAVVLDLTESERAIGYRPSVDLVTGLSGVWRYFRDQSASVR